MVTIKNVAFVGQNVLRYIPQGFELDNGGFEDVETLDPSMTKTSIGTRSRRVALITPPVLPYRVVKFQTSTITVLGSTESKQSLAMEI